MKLKGLGPEAKRLVKKCLKHLKTMVTMDGDSTQLSCEVARLMHPRPWHGHEGLWRQANLGRGRFHLPRMLSSTLVTPTGDSQGHWMSLDVIGAVGKLDLPSGPICKPPSSIYSSVPVAVALKVLIRSHICVFICFPGVFLGVSKSTALGASPGSRLLECLEALVSNKYEHDRSRICTE